MGLIFGQQGRKHNVVALVVVLCISLNVFVITNSFVAEAQTVQGEPSTPSPFIYPGPIAPAAPAAPDVVESTNCRYGVGYVPGTTLSDRWIPTVGAGWYGTFYVWGLEQPSSEFVPIVRMRQDFVNGVRQPTYTFTPSLDEIALQVERRPGALWLIGNEIEIDNSSQDNMMPEVYARAYHEAYTLIKDVDPTARVGIGSVTMGTPGRLQYLEIVWDTYQQLYGRKMPVDIWNVHIYILSERTLFGNNYADGKIALGTDPELAFKSSASDPLKCPPPNLPDTTENDPRPDVYCKSEYDSLRIFSEQVRNFRQFMKDHGEQDKPLIISEFGLLNSYTNPQPNCGCEHPQDEFGRCMCPERVIAYLEGTTNFLENAVDLELGYPEDDYRLVQRWLWYSIHTDYRIGRSSNLLEPDFATFPLGSPAALTPVGQAYRQLANAPSNQTNLVASQANSVHVFVEDAADTASATLVASFRNDGTLSAGHPFLVSFYADEMMTELIGHTLVNTNESGAVMGCRWTEPDYVVEFEWTDLPVGTHQFWARIDSSDSISESSEDDNVTPMGTVTVYSHNEFTHETFMPLTRGE